MKENGCQGEGDEEQEGKGKKNSYAGSEGQSGRGRLGKQGRRATSQDPLPPSYCVVKSQTRREV